MKNNVLIIGNGFVGSKLYDYLTSDNIHGINAYKIHGLNYYNPKSVANRLENEILTGKIDYVVNCVGYTGTPNVDGCEDNKQDTWALNVTWPALLANICAKFDTKLINISSGCIYTGYEKEFTESCEPNFGLWSAESSWYSKTKHACEMTFEKYENVYNFRIRMPITGNLNEKKNYLTKILKYNNLIDFANSKTVIEDLLNFTYRFIIQNRQSEFPSGNYNIVNPQPLSTKDIVDILDGYNFWNPNWKWISLEELYKSTKCGRSNCVLSTDYTIKTTGIDIPTEKESIIRVLENGK